MNSNPLPRGPFDVVVADPPWWYSAKPGHSNSARNHYGVMTQEELTALPVREVMSKRSALFVWATCPRLDYAIDTIRAWGLNYRGVAWIWIKTRKTDGGIIEGRGVVPTFTKPMAELVLVATTVKTGRPFPILSLKESQYLRAPPGRHSEKPDLFYDRLERLVGDRPRLDMFARVKRHGWESWGNEIGPDTPYAPTQTKIPGTW